MKVKVIAHTPDPEKTVAAAARLCYSKISATEILENFSQEKAASFIKKLMDMGHMSPTEHVSFTFAIDGVSRTLLAQITRHRIGSYSVQSLRYNNPFDEETANPEVDNGELEAESISYLEGLAISCRLTGKSCLQHQHLMEQYNVKGSMPQEVNNLHGPAYLRGIFDGAGLLSDGANWDLTFPQELKAVFDTLHINITPKGDKLLIQNPSDFGTYIYENMNFAESLYDEDKFLALCAMDDKLKKQLLSIMQNFMDAKYYAMAPESIAQDPKALLAYIKGLHACKKCYIDLVKMGIDKEDARYILPHGTQTRIVMTMNVRSLYNFFNLRCCERAQTEIRQLANMMLEEVKKIAPGLFESAGAPCEALGYCPEGVLSCGKYPSYPN